MNATAIKPLFLVQSGPSFVFIVSSLDMTADPVDAVALPLDQALHVAHRLRASGFSAEVVPIEQAMRRRFAVQMMYALLLIFLFLCAAIFWARSAFAEYRFVIADPVQVCIVPDDGITINRRSGSLAGHCFGDKIFADGFQSGAPR